MDDRILDEAASWHAASDDDAMDWDGFTSWLEADPRHVQAYDEVALADSLVGDHRDALVGVLDAGDTQAQTEQSHRARHTWQRWAGAAIAASLVGLMVIPNFLPASPEIYETAGSSRTIALADGSKVILAPRSSLAIEGEHQVRMTLSGGGWFDIVHDPDRPLAITAGDVTISDIGTQFDVQSDLGQVRVEVADGKVEVRSATLASPIRLGAGKGLLFDASAGTASISKVSPNDAGEWREGRLTYDLAPLPLVAADLARYAGVSVTVPDSLSNRRFSGTLVIDNGEAAVRDLSQVMELGLRRDARGYRLGERTGTGK